MNPILNQSILRATQCLTSAEKTTSSSCNAANYPSVVNLESLISTIRTVFFPEYFGRRRTDADLRRYYVGINIERVAEILQKEIYHALLYKDVCDTERASRMADDLTARFLDSTCLIRDTLYTDAQAILDNDPAVNDLGEVILCYPAMRALLNHRVAHELLRLEVPLLPRMLAEMAHSQTGIDINPGARIGSHFAIDHGTGIVIGQTAVIGDHCTIYQGVTLGARNFAVDADGHPLDTPRHPILEDHVTVYAGATILGRITVGHNTIVGGNVWLTTDVPPYSRIVQHTARNTIFTDGAGI